MGLFEIHSEHFGGEVKVIRAKTFHDNRGSLTVTYLENEYGELGLPKFVRRMHTRSSAGVIRGLHYQFNPPMGKLIEVMKGSVLLVTVDLRPKSPTFLEHTSLIISGSKGLQVWAPAGFARGYYAYTDDTIVQYSCDAYVGADQAIRWDDPSIGINWPVKNPILSERDANAATVKEYWASLWRQK